MGPSRRPGGAAQPGQKDEGGVGSAPVKVAFDKAQDQQAAYAQGEERPLGGYLLLMAAYGAGVLGLSGLVRRSGRGLPERIGVADLALIGVATHKCARLLAKDPVTSPLRAPFTTFKSTSGPAELQEEPRGNRAAQGRRGVARLPLLRRPVGCHRVRLRARTAATGNPAGGVGLCGADCRRLPAIRLCHG